jgi:hypothetical protein
VPELHGRRMYTPDYVSLGDLNAQKASHLLAGR